MGMSVKCMMRKMIFVVMIIPMRANIVVKRRTTTLGPVHIVVKIQSRVMHVVNLWGANGVRKQICVVHPQQMMMNHVADCLRDTIGICIEMWAPQNGVAPIQLGQGRSVVSAPWRMDNVQLTSKKHPRSVGRGLFLDKK